MLLAHKELFRGRDINEYPMDAIERDSVGEICPEARSILMSRAVAAVFSALIREIVTRRTSRDRGRLVTNDFGVNVKDSRSQIGNSSRHSLHSADEPVVRFARSARSCSSKFLEMTPVVRGEPSTDWGLADGFRNQFMDVAMFSTLSAA
jgi:hypothetical protein